jgi:hypothetical protein
MKPACTDAFKVTPIPPGSPLHTGPVRGQYEAYGAVWIHRNVAASLDDDGVGGGIRSAVTQQKQQRRDT